MAKILKSLKTIILGIKSKFLRTKKHSIKKCVILCVSENIKFIIKVFETPSKNIWEWKFLCVATMGAGG